MRMHFVGCETPTVLGYYNAIQAKKQRFYLRRADKTVCRFFNVYLISEESPEKFSVLSLIIYLGLCLTSIYILPIYSPSTPVQIS